MIEALGFTGIQFAAASKAALAIIFNAIIAMALLLFLLVLIRGVIFNGEWKTYSLFGKIFSIAFLVFVLLLMIGIFFVAMRTGNE